nr:hypothetical protein [uncultured Hyphomonas sp.]
MNRFIRLTVFTFLAWTTFAWPAAALEEHNPLDKLEPEKFCTKKTMDPDLDFPDGNAIEPFRISRDDVLAAAIGSNALAVNPQKALLQKPGSLALLDRTRSVFDVVVDQLVPCVEYVETGGSAKKKAGKDAVFPSSYDARVNACKNQKDRYQSGKDKRYSSGDARVVRQNLLRLFQSSLHGGTKQLIVARRTSTTGHAGDGTIPEDWLFKPDYVPDKDRFEDDIHILNYLYAEDGHEPVVVICSKLTFEMPDGQEEEVLYSGGSFSIAPSSTDTASSRVLVAHKPAGDAGGLWNTLLKQPFKERSLISKKKQKPVPVNRQDSKANPNSFEARTINRVEMNVSRAEATEVLSYTKENTSTYQLVLAKDAGQFIKNAKKRKGAEFGTTLPQAEDGVIDSGNLEFAADAFLGLHLRVGESLTGSPGGRKDAPSYTGSWAWGLTPYAGINQASQKMKVYEPNKDGVLALTQKKFGYAKITYGARLDYTSTLPPEPRLGKDLIAPHLIHSTGLSRKGVGVGAYAEYITDNHNLLNARKFGGYFSPPSNWFGLMGNFYGQSYPIDVFQRKLTPAVTDQTRYYWTDDLESGWYLNWDLVGVIEDINHVRLPRDFEAAPCYGLPSEDCVKPEDTFWPRKSAKDIVTGAAYGTDFSVSLGRYELLGLGKEDLFGELTAKWVYRRELDRTNSADLWNLSLKVQDPTGSENRYWKVEYVVGEDYVTSTEEERISFKIVLAN